MLIAGGAIIIVSFAIAIPLLFSQQQAGEAGEGKSGAQYTIGPGQTVQITREVQGGGAVQLAYSITFQDLKGTTPAITVSGPDGETLHAEKATSFVATAPVEAAKPGNYTLAITNPSSTATLEAFVIFGEPQAELVASSFMLYAGITVAVAGGALTVLDRVRAKKMKQFGDVSDLR
jgi:hypothetical protein